MGDASAGLRALVPGQTGIPLKAQQHDGGQNSCQQRISPEVQPDSCKAQGPESQNQDDREKQGEGEGNEGRACGIAHRQHIALNREGKPADQIGQGKKLQGAHRHRIVSGGRLPDKDHCQLPGKEEEDGRGGKGDHGAGGKAAAFNGRHPLPVACAPVEADGRLQGIAHAIEQRLDEAFGVHENSVDGDGCRAAHPQQNCVQQDGGDAACDIIQKIRTSAGNDLADHGGGEPGLSKFQLQPPACEPGKGDQRAGCHAQAGGQGSAPDAEAEIIEEDKFQARDQGGHTDVQEHAETDLPADPQIIVHGEDDGRHRGAEGVDPYIAYGVREEPALRSQKAHEEGSRRIEDGADGRARRHDHQAGAGKDIIGLFVFFLAQVHGDGHRGSHADEIGQGKIDNDKGHGQIERGKGRLSEYLPYHHAIQELVEGRGQHTDGSGKGGDEKQLYRGRLGK